RSVLLDAKADLLVYGNGERQICELAHRLAGGESIHDITDVRGTVFARRGIPADWIEIDSTHLDAPGPLNAPLDPYAMGTSAPAAAHWTRGAARAAVPGARWDASRSPPSAAASAGAPAGASPSTTDASSGVARKIPCCARARRWVTRCRASPASFPIAAG